MFPFVLNEGNVHNTKPQVQIYISKFGLAASDLNQALKLPSYIVCTIH